MDHGDHNQGEVSNCFFLTLTVVDWVDLFVRPVYKQVIVHSLNHFTENKGLKIYAWCLMSNHLHLMAGTREGQAISELEKEFKRFTTPKLLEGMTVEPARRRKWMMTRFENLSNKLGLLKKYQVWHTCTNPVFISPNNPLGLLERVEYIHDNPVRDRIVTAAEDYLYSSARDYAGMKGLVNIHKIPSVIQHISIAGNVHGNFFGRYIRN
ncbi:MAG TPA: transposase [Chitinophagaceae bacterium]|nr:transposase [Chitinophagaceae bacterium]